MLCQYVPQFVTNTSASENTLLRCLPSAGSSNAGAESVYRRCSA